MHDGCPLCQPNHKEIIIDTPHFYLKASKSTFDILIIPKIHFTHLTDITDDLILEFSELKKLVRKILKADFGGCIFYEHTGSGIAWSFVGHGDGHNHAHLHCASVTSQFLDKIPDGYIPRQTNSFTEIWSTKKDNPLPENYFYFEDQDERGYIIHVNDGGDFFMKESSR